MILQAIRNGLQLQTEDVLLELACGNGALTVQLFDSCHGYLGIDISEYLISVAQQNFERPPDYVFAVQDGGTYVHQEAHPERFTHALCYAAFQYFPDPVALDLLKTLHERFANLKRIFVGNLPDRAKAAAFYMGKPISNEELSDPATAIGIWRTQEAFAQLAEAAGWQVDFSVMPAEFSAAYYRYDATLTRAD
ncbi:MAG: class I SAM-dependent methyltransferase [Betaproteobacteria bacterium]|nr:class I SAM-dependent methyltransferase [Betaproteobacteria bacterium]